MSPELPGRLGDSFGCFHLNRDAARLDVRAGSPVVLCIVKCRQPVRGRLVRPTLRHLEPSHWIAEETPALWRLLAETTICGLGLCDCKPFHPNWALNGGDRPGTARFPGLAPLVPEGVPGPRPDRHRLRFPGVDMEPSRCRRRSKTSAARFHQSNGISLWALASREKVDTIVGRPARIPSTPTG